MSLGTTVDRIGIEEKTNLRIMYQSDIIPLEHDNRDPYR
jgi:hypothetical protein